MKLLSTFTNNIKQGLRTGVYGGPISQTIAVALFVAALWVGGAVFKGFVTMDELTSEPLDTLHKIFEPTFRPAIEWVKDKIGS